MRKALLLCGFAASLLYVGTDIVAGALWEGYSFASQPISDLSAIGAPTKPLVDPLLTAYSVLMAAFGFGAWGSAGESRALRAAAGLFIGGTVVNFLWPPLNLGEPMNSFTNTMHSVFAGLTVLLILLKMVLGAYAYRGWFRLYTVVTILASFVAGAVTFWLAASGPNSWFGFIERINVYSYMLWVAVLAAVLSRAEESQNRYPSALATVPR